MKLVSKTGGSCNLFSFTCGLFEHDGELYVARAQWVSYDNAPQEQQSVRVVRCSDGAIVRLCGAASIYPVEAVND